MDALSKRRPGAKEDPIVRRVPAHVATRERARAAHRAQRLSWILRRALASDPSVWVSTCAWVRTESGLVRPYVCVCSGAPPVNGIVAAPPQLVLQPEGAPWAPVGTWLDAGVDEVWTLTRSTVTVHGLGAHGLGEGVSRERADVHDLSQGGVLIVPGSRAAVDIAAVLGG